MVGQGSLSGADLQHTVIGRGLEGFDDLALKIGIDQEMLPERPLRRRARPRAHDLS